MNPHIWIAVVTYRITEDEARAAFTPDRPQLVLSRDKVYIPPTIGCYACELSWSEAHDTSCAGEPVFVLGPGGVRRVPS